MWSSPAGEMGDHQARETDELRWPKSLVMGIKVVAENLQEGVSKHTNTCYFTMVAKDADGNTAQVPPLILKTHDDVRRFPVRLSVKDCARPPFMDKYRQDFVYDTASAELLNDQRCHVMLEPEFNDRHRSLHDQSTSDATLWRHCPQSSVHAAMTGSGASRWLSLCGA